MSLASPSKHSRARQDPAATFTTLHPELRNYLNEPTQSFDGVEDVVRWWQMRQETFPNLSKMACNYASVPGMKTSIDIFYVLQCVIASTVEVERTFSRGRVLLGHLRNRISAETTSRTMDLKAWWDAGIIDISEIVVTSE
jgi:hypothetical protein